MNLAFYTAATGTIQLQKGIDVVSNNIANVSTTGFQPSQPSFSDLLYTNIHGNEDLNVGHGVKLQKTDTPPAQGGVLSTGRNLDYALTQPNTYFALQMSDGVRFTRSGDFFSSNLNGEFYLASPQGGLVLDADGKPITVPDGDLEQMTGALPVGVYTFSNPEGLTREGSSLFAPTDLSGAPRVIAPALTGDLVKMGYLEPSGVNLASEMSTVIQLQRAFQFNTRMVQISDEIEQTINNLR